MNSWPACRDCCGCWTCGWFHPRRRSSSQIPRGRSWPAARSGLVTETTLRTPHTPHITQIPHFHNILLWKLFLLPYIVTFTIFVGHWILFEKKTLNQVHLCVFNLFLLIIQPCSPPVWAPLAHHLEAEINCSCTMFKLIISVSLYVICTWVNPTRARNH